MAETDGRTAEQELHAERVVLHSEGDALTSRILRILPSESGQDELERKHLRQLQAATEGVRPGAWRHAGWRQFIYQPQQLPHCPGMRPPFGLAGVTVLPSISHPPLTPARPQDHTTVNTTMIYAHLAPQDDQINVLQRRRKLARWYTPSLQMGAS